VIPTGIIKAMVEMATDCEATSQQMEKKFEHWPMTYFWFNVEQGLQKVKLGDWERMDEVSAHSRSYMSMHEVDQRLATAVEAIKRKVPNQHSTAQTFQEIPSTVRSGYLTNYGIPSVSEPTYQPDYRLFVTHTQSLTSAVEAPSISCSGITQPSTIRSETRSVSVPTSSTSGENSSHSGSCRRRGSRKYLT